MASVLSRENTRESICVAMKQKEVFATTGSRIRVRVFGGFDFSEQDLARSDFAENGYDKGVPMGGDLAAGPEGVAPGFLTRANRDWANLDRIQIVKGWVTDSGDTTEKVFDMVWSGDRVIRADGKLPAVGNTFDLDASS